MLEYIDAAIGRREPLSKIIKLLSLFCLADDGFASKTFDQYRRDIIQVNCLCTQQRKDVTKLSANQMGSHGRCARAECVGAHLVSRHECYVGYTAHVYVSCRAGWGCSLFGSLQMVPLRYSVEGVVFCGLL